MYVVSESEASREEEEEEEKREEGLEANRDDIEVASFIIASSMPTGEHTTSIGLLERKVMRHQAIEPCTNFGIFKKSADPILASVFTCEGGPLCSAYHFIHEVARRGFKLAFLRHEMQEIYDVICEVKIE